MSQDIGYRFVLFEKAKVRGGEQYMGIVGLSQLKAITCRGTSNRYTVYNGVALAFKEQEPNDAFQICHISDNSAEWSRKRKERTRLKP